MSPQYQTKLFGYCEINATELIDRLNQKECHSLINLKGDYCWIAESDRDCYIITSPYSLCQYYYTLQNDRFFHGETILEVRKKSGLPWQWNWAALADLSTFDHTLEEDTLHPQISKVPLGSYLHFSEGKLICHTLSWETLNPSQASSAQQTLDRFNEAVQDWLQEPVGVSLSAGFDSRLLLASVLKAGVRPFVFTMGTEDSTDVIISRQIARHFQLDHQVVQLKFEDYFTQGNKISRLTNGTKVIRHWHTYFYPSYIQIPANSIVYIGTNGGFAKNFYYDKGILSLYKNRLSPSQTLKQIWSNRLRWGTLFKPEELDRLHPHFAQELGVDGQRQRLDRVIQLCHGRLMGGLERFYLTHRVQNFMGNGFKLYEQHLNIRTPFLNRDWVKSTWNLDYPWRLGNNWHRFAIAKTLPELMNFAEQGETTDRLLRRAPLGYWREKHKRLPVVPYCDQREWFRNDQMVDFLTDQATILSDVIDPNLVHTIALENQKTGGRFMTVSFLATQIFWHQCMAADLAEIPHSSEHLSG